MSRVDLTALIPHPTSIKIPSTRYVHSSITNEVVTVYEMEIEMGDHKWTKGRRFKDFDTLHQQLTALLEGDKALPPLPAKTILGFGNKNPKLIEKRRTELESLMQTLLTIPVVLNSSDFGEFIGVIPPPASQAAPSTSASSASADTFPLASQTGYSNLPTELVQRRFTEDNFTFQVNWMVHDPNSHAIFAVCEDGYVLSRVDSKLSNRLSKDKKEELPIGALYCFKLSDYPHGSYVLKHHIFYQDKATAVAWDPERKYIFVGLSNGNIIVYSCDDSFEVKVVHEMAPHKLRITQLAYDAESHLLLSISKDKSISVFDVRANSIVAAGPVKTKSWPSAVCFDAKSSMAYIATLAWEILCVDLSVNPPAHVAELKGHSGSIRCLFHSPLDQYLFSGGFDSKAGVWELKKRDDSNDTVVDPTKLPSEARLCGWLAGGPQHEVSAITYIRPYKQVAVGYDHGMVALWDARTGILWHAWKVSPTPTAITCLQYDPKSRVLLVAAGPQITSWWFPPTYMTQSLYDPSADKDSPLTEPRKIAAKQSNDLNLADLRLRESGEVTEKMGSVGLLSGGDSVEVLDVAPSSPNEDDDQPYVVSDL